MDRSSNPPFALRLFYRTGAFHRPDEFSSSSLPPHLTVHTWQDCTLTELSHHLAASPSPSTSSILPDPAIGTRLAFRLIYPDTRSGNHNLNASRFMVKDLGSVVIGDGGPGLDPADVEAETKLESADSLKTLFDARFVVGDFISVAILPPLGDGNVAPVNSARMGRGAGAGEAGAVVGRAPGMVGAGRERENGPGRRPGRGRGGGRQDGFGRGGLPMGEWRRGEDLPDAPSGRSRGRGRF